MLNENFGKYQLLKRLAMGGMAQIYLARQRGPEGVDKQLVIKRILPHLGENEDFVRMFLDEARIAARLNHPNIVEIFDLGAQDDSFFIAMEYIHGEDLRRVWKHAERSGQLIPVPLVCRIMIEACAGLDYAHKQKDAQGKPLGIVHRDISPQNILLTFEGRVKVVDFGIAKAADQATVTRSGVLKGKYSYMSPEQAAGQKNLDCRTDIFALGVVLYELLTGMRLFKRHTDMATLQAVADCEIAPPSQINPRVPKDLDPIVMKALTREPEDRYAEALQLQLALEDWLLAHPVPSSTAHVAAFMKELYAARLAEEARLGDVLVEEAESGSPPALARRPRGAREVLRRDDGGAAPAGGHAGAAGAPGVHGSVGAGAPAHAGPVLPGRAARLLRAQGPGAPAHRGPPPCPGSRAGGGAALGVLRESRTARYARPRAEGSGELRVRRGHVAVAVAEAEPGASAGRASSRRACSRGASPEAVPYRPGGGGGGTRDGTGPGWVVGPALHARTGGGGARDEARSAGALAARSRAARAFPGGAEARRGRARPGGACEGSAAAGARAARDGGDPGASRAGVAQGPGPFRGEANLGLGRGLLWWKQDGRDPLRGRADDGRHA